MISTPTQTIATCGQQDSRGDRILSDAPPLAPGAISPCRGDLTPGRDLEIQRPWFASCGFHSVNRESYAGLFLGSTSGLKAVGCGRAAVAEGEFGWLLWLQHVQTARREMCCQRGEVTRRRCKTA